MPTQIQVSIKYNIYSDRKSFWIKKSNNCFKIHKHAKKVSSQNIYTFCFVITSLGIIEKLNALKIN